MFRVKCEIMSTGLAAFVLMNALPATAVDRHYLINFSGNWNLASNWSPLGVPANNDRVFIDNSQSVRLDVHTNALDDLFVSEGGDVRTNGFLLAVSGGSEPLTEIAGAGSRIRVSPRNDSSVDRGFDTNRLILSDGGILQMLGGSTHVYARAFIDSTGLVVGRGRVEIFNSSSVKLDNRGVIRAEGGTLTIESNGGGRFVLDGGTSPTGRLEAVDGNSTLVIDGQLDNDFSGAVKIGAGNTIEFMQSWATDVGLIDFDASGGVGTLRGATLTHGGTLNVNSGTALVEAPLTFRNSSVVNIAAGATLDFDLNLNDIRGILNLNGGISPGTEPVVDGSAQRLLGTMNVSGLTKFDTSLQFLANSSTNFASGNSSLEMKFGGFARSGAFFSGDGRIVNLATGLLTAEHGADIDVQVINQGGLTIGPSIGQAEVESYTQTSSGELIINLANVTPGNFDVITVQGNAVLAGNLKVGLRNGFTPVLGNSFTFLETEFGNVAGTFHTQEFPVFNGLTFDVVYNPKSVVLQVVAANLSGDFDNDGDVDGRDFLVWQRNPSVGNLADWQGNYGAPFPISTAVPEPCACCLLLVGAGGLVARRSTQRLNHPPV